MIPGGMPVLGKTVWVLGAGTSSHAGIPLLRDFLVKARLLQRSTENLFEKEAFKTVFEWIDSLRGAAYYTNLDLDNLEHLFSIAEMSRQAGKDDLLVWDSIKKLVLETIERSARFGMTRKGRALDETYSAFLGALLSLEKARKESLPQATKNFERDVIITFNYDVLLDDALYRNGESPNYGIGDLCDLQEAANRDQKFKLFKLHGSLNWGVCSECSKKEHGGRVQEINLSMDTSNGFSNILPVSGEKVEFQLVQKLRALSCPECRTAARMSPMIIPPTWSKTIINKAMARVWSGAIDELKTACQIFVIGYSMPQTDTFFQYLLTLGLTQNSELQRIFVVNKSCDEDLKGRYRRVFSKSFDEREKLRFEQKEFKSFVDGHMQKMAQCWD